MSKMIESLNVRLNTLLKLDRKRAQLKQELRAWQLEQEHFNEYYSRQNVVEIEKLPLLKSKFRPDYFFPCGNLAGERTRVHGKADV